MVGLAGGVASGLLGIGGGVVMVPLIVVLLSRSQREAHAISLAAIAPIAVVAVAVYLSRGELWWAAALLIAAGSMIGAPLGVKVLRRAPERFLRLGFGFVALAAGLRLVLV